MARAFLSLGSNLGDRRGTLELCLRALEASGQVSVLRRSSLYETAPLGVTDQPRFYNLVVEIDTDLEPETLLDLCQAVERDLGRIRVQRWGPRTADLDILLFDGRTIATARLIVPHAEMLRRRFILEPLLEIAPDAALPDGRPLAPFLTRLADQDVRRVERA